MGAGLRPAGKPPDSPPDPTLLRALHFYPDQHKASMAELHLLEYQDAWASEYLKVADELRSAVATPGCIVEHIGSTSVPGLCSKPVLDILLGVTSLAETDAFIPALVARAYVYRPEYESHIPDRRYFVRPAGLAPRVHLHVVVLDGTLWRQHLNFRDQLRQDPQLLQSYAALKKCLAVAYVADKAAYTEAKGPFIRHVLSSCTFSPARAWRPTVVAQLARTLGGVKTVPASLQDAEGIADAHVSAWQKAYRGIVSDEFLDAMSVKDRAVRWQALLKDHECTILVAKAQEQVLGFISFGKHREPQAGAEEGEVWTMYVHPTAWRGGLGRSLMSEALESLKDHGYRSTWVWVLAANQRAIAFYLSCGFKLDEGSTRHFQLGGQRLEEVALFRNAA